MFNKSINIEQQINHQDYLECIIHQLLELIPDNFATLALIPDYLSNYIINKSQKNLRSNILLTFLPQSLLQPTEKPLIITYCVILELLNIATKIHSLIGDKNNKNWLATHMTLDQAILIGDLIFTIAFEKMTSLDDIEILEVFSQATKQMALYEAKIAEFMHNHEAQNLNHDSETIQELVELIEQKHLPLYETIIFFLKKSNPTLTNDACLFIQNLNKINILNKLSKKSIYFNESYSSVIYSLQNLDKINIQLELLIAKQTLLTRFENNIDLTPLISLARK